MRQFILTACAVLWLGSSIEAQAPMGNYSKDPITGKTVREFHRTIRRPVTRTRIEQRQEVVYRERFVTEYQQVPRTYFTPVTEYQWEPRVHNWWNPFGPTYVAYHPVPRTRWITQTRTDRVPVTRRELVSTKRTVNVPVTEHGFENREVIERVVIHTPPRIPQSQLAGQPRRPIATVARHREVFGGTEQMDGRYPRRGLSLGAKSSTVFR